MNKYQMTKIINNSIYGSVGNGNFKITYEEMYEIMKCMIGRDVK